jgi:hypothetical protein
MERPIYHGYGESTPPTLDCLSPLQIDVKGISEDSFVHSSATATGPASVPGSMPIVRPYQNSPFPSQGPKPEVGDGASERRQRQRSPSVATQPPATASHQVLRSDTPHQSRHSVASRPTAPVGPPHGAIGPMPLTPPYHAHLFVPSSPSEIGTSTFAMQQGLMPIMTTPRGPEAPRLPVNCHNGATSACSPYSGKRLRHVPPMNQPNAYRRHITPNSYIDVQGPALSTAQSSRNGPASFTTNIQPPVIPLPYVAKPPLAQSVIPCPFPMNYTPRRRAESNPHQSHSAQCAAQGSYYRESEYPFASQDLAQMAPPMDPANMRRYELQDQPPIYPRWKRFPSEHDGTPSYQYSRLYRETTAMLTGSASTPIEGKRRKRRERAASDVGDHRAPNPSCLKHPGAPMHPNHQFCGLSGPSAVVADVDVKRHRKWSFFSCFKGNKKH